MEITAEEGRVLDALKLLDLVMTANPNDAKAISTRGWINGRVGQQLIDAGKAADSAEGAMGISSPIGATRVGEAPSAGTQGDWNGSNWMLGIGRSGSSWR